MGTYEFGEIIIITITINCFHISEIEMEIILTFVLIVFISQGL